MFSSTTMASSTTRPMARTRARSVSRFTEKPRANKAMKLAMTETGTVTAGIRVARRLPRKRKITSTTRPTAMARVLKTSAMACSMKTEVS
jgi:Flp pilus assembly protein TadG